MTTHSLSLFAPFLSRKRKSTLEIAPVTEDTIPPNLSTENKASAEEQGFKGTEGQLLILRNKNGAPESILAGVSKDAHRYKDGAKIYNAIKTAFGKEMLDETSFTFTGDNTEHLCIGWGWAAYKFDMYKKPEDEPKAPALTLPKTIDKKRIKTFVESVCLIRDLVNIPANNMGPDELEEATKFLCDTHEIKLKTIKDKELLTKNFPMIYAVGKGSSRRPRLLDFSWGNTKHPKITLVGKGVCFDTGGLDIKPSPFMLTMKKDMGGSAHVLALAHMIISLKLPIRLRVLIPAVENAISGDSYRPSDILDSRKGSTVEVGNTDAEGRLVLADALTYAAEEEPELIIDFATLTGAARIALGLDLPAMFATNKDTATELQETSSQTEIDDPIWNLPLWKPYKKELESSVADISSTGGKAGSITAALFLQHFTELKDKAPPEWIHMDIFAWEQSGKTGRPKGGADTGLRAIFDYLEKRYGGK